MSILICAPPQRARAPVWAVALTLVGLAFTPGSARADFIFNAVGTVNGNAVNATVDISFIGSQMTVVLTNNLTTNNESVGSAITGISITTDPTLTANTLTDTYGQLRNGNGYVTETNGVLSNGTGITHFDGGTGTGENALSLSPWSVVTTTPGTINVFGDGSPNGSVAGSGTLGSSLTNGAHTPVFSNSVTLVSNVTPYPIGSVTSVTFQFGTNQSTGYMTGTPVTAVPAPSSLALALTGLVGLGLTRVRRFQRTG
jgi:hypothetical protein